MIKIPGYEDLYSISDDGRIYSHISEKFLKPGVNHSGYLYVGLRKERRVKNHFVHRLVITVVKGLIIPNGFEVDHIDRDKSNNHPENLRVLSHHENTLHHHGRLNVDDADHKICCTCKEVLPRLNFARFSNSRDGLNSSCKPCMRLYKKDRRAKCL